MYAELKDSAGNVRFAPTCTAYVSGYAHAGGWRDSLLLLELAGARSEIRAVWANVVKSRTARGITSTDITVYAGAHSDAVYIDTGIKYRTIQTADTLVIVAPAMTRAEYNYVCDGDTETPSPWFMTALQARLPYPVVKEWKQTLWRLALQAGLVAPAKTSLGISAWSIDYAAEAWENLLGQAVRDGLLAMPQATQRRTPRPVADWRAILSPPRPTPALTWAQKLRARKLQEAL